ncbi:toll/interleukin-1 receptor domain-containing protein [Streptomyces sp. NPDC087844]|uniref:toll/interleukin-1 receptor domain-containing protein n=1 Tax=Streptomyces sp. NPDC087844 TaxID=3365805 RepID=UPI00380635B0
MQIFISWSGDASKQCAEALRDWLPYMNQAITPFVSSQDISKGERGLNKIATQLQECSLGIVCVTRDNQAAPWINFESGALSRELGESSLIPFLLDMPIKDLSGPLTQFQATDSIIEEDVWAMVKTINDKSAVTVDQERLKNTFERFWDDLTQSLNIIRKERPQSDVQPRDTSEILNELVGLVREQNTRIGELESVISNKKEEHTAEELKASIRGNSAITRRLTSTRILAILGEDSVKNMVRVAGGFQVHCTQKSINHAHAVSDQLAEVAQQTGLSIDVLFEGSGEIMSFPF